MVLKDLAWFFVSFYKSPSESQQILNEKALCWKMWQKFDNSLLPHKSFPSVNFKFLKNHANKPFGGVRFESPPAQVSLCETLNV